MDVKCDTGYSFRDGTRSVTVECLESKQWNATVDDCEGTLKLFLIYLTWLHSASNKCSDYRQTKNTTYMYIQVPDIMIIDTFFLTI